MKNARRAAMAAVAAIAVFALLPAATAQAAAKCLKYVALGDSYSSGTGAGPYFDEACQRSDQAYPALLADELGGRFAFAACSGATTRDLLADQIGAVKRSTGLVTVGIGGNDIGWGTAVGACMQPESFDCTPVVEAAEAAVRDQLPGLLDEVYTAIEQRAPRADVYVLGYPRLFNEREPCASIPYVTPEEQALMNQAADLLSEVIEAKAGEYGFTYVDVRDAFDGHAVCDADSWIHGYTGTSESFHPNAAGQAAYYAALSAAR